LPKGITNKYKRRIVIHPNGAVVSHPIPLHAAGKLERALDAQLQRFAARGAKGWVMRIVAYFACQYARAVIELLEGLLAEYRAGTLVLPAMLDDPSTIPAECDTGYRQNPRARVRALARGVDDSSTNPARCEPRTTESPQMPAEPAASPARVPARVMVPRRMRVPSGAIAGDPPAVPIPPAEKFGDWVATPTHAHFVTITEPSVGWVALATHHLRAAAISAPPSPRQRMSAIHAARTCFSIPAPRCYRRAPS
jgi:hypothetical protein